MQEKHKSSKQPTKILTHISLLSHKCDDDDGSGNDNADCCACYERAEREIEGDKNTHNNNGGHQQYTKRIIITNKGKKHIFSEVFVSYLFTSLFREHFASKRNKKWITHMPYARAYTRYPTRYPTRIRMGHTNWRTNANKCWWCFEFVCPNFVDRMRSSFCLHYNNFVAGILSRRRTYQKSNQSCTVVVVDFSFGTSKKKRSKSSTSEFHLQSVTVIFDV